MAKKSRGRSCPRPFNFQMENITWSEMGKQTAQAKEVYCRAFLLKQVQKFAKQAKNIPQHARIMSLVGK